MIFSRGPVSLIVFALLISLAIPGALLADSDGEYYFVDAATLNVRKEADSGSRVVGKLNRNDTVRVIDKSFFSKWWEIDSPVNGYVHADYLKEKADDKRLYVTAETLNVRREADTGSSVVGRLSEGEEVKAVRKVGSGQWWEIESPVKGFVYARFLSEDQGDEDEDDDDSSRSYSRSSSSGSYNFVVGGGLGAHFFINSDETREAGSDSAAIYSLGIRLFGEWYATNNIGFGGLMNYQIANRSYTDKSGIKDRDIDQKWTIGHYFATINYLPFGIQNSTNMLLYGGLGTSVMVYDEDASGTSRNHPVSEKTSGTSLTTGICLDLGGDGFGTRFGAQYIMTNYEDLEFNGEKYSVSTDGLTFHVDLRWAF